MVSLYPTRGALGAEIRGVDLSREMDEMTFRNIVEALHEFEVVFFRDQELTPGQHIAFSRRFGELEHHVRQFVTLPDETQTKLLGRNAVNSYIHGYSRDRKSGTRKALTEEQKRKTPDREHPAVRTHPYTGRKCLFVNEGYTTQIVGLEEAESTSILAGLFEHIPKNDHTYRHRWRIGDFLIWDNCAVQHRAVIDYELPLRRRMERTTLTGTVPF